MEQVNAKEEEVLLALTEEEIEEQVQLTFNTLIVREQGIIKVGEKFVEATGEFDREAVNIMKAHILENLPEGYTEKKVNKLFEDHFIILAPLCRTALLKLLR